MPQVGKGLPRDRSRSTCLMGGTHCGMEGQLGAAKHSNTWQPSTARAGVGASVANASSRALMAPAQVIWGRPVREDSCHLAGPDGRSTFDGWFMFRALSSAVVWRGIPCRLFEHREVTLGLKPHRPGAGFGPFSSTPAAGRTRCPPTWRLSTRWCIRTRWRSRNSLPMPSSSTPAVPRRTKRITCPGRSTCRLLRLVLPVFTR
jgi:hypothetical protein